MSNPTPEREKITNRIRKLLALADNNNSVEEAALAASRAQELMLRHQIEVADVEQTDEEEAAANELVIGEFFEGRQRSPWKARLWWGTCAAYNCDAYVWNGSSHTNRAKKEKHTVRYAAAGRKANIEAATYTYKWLKKVILVLAQKEYHHSARRLIRSFCIGAAEMVAERLKVNRKDIYRSVSSTALIRADEDLSSIKAAAPDLFKETGLNVGPGKGSATHVESGAYHSGRAAGADIPLQQDSAPQLREAPKQLK